jgi:hypothetical protein
VFISSSVHLFIGCRTAAEEADEKSEIKAAQHVTYKYAAASLSQGRAWLEAEA